MHTNPPKPPTLRYAANQRPRKRFFTPVGLFMLGGLSLAWVPVWSFATNWRMGDWKDLIPYTVLLAVAALALTAGFMRFKSR